MPKINWPWVRAVTKNDPPPEINTESTSHQAVKREQAGGKVDCPSFDNEPWKSRAEKLRAKSKDEFFMVDWNTTPITPPPLPLNHGYIKLYLEFLDTVPEECWIDEENEVD